jgi:hypothetical protein
MKNTPAEPPIEQRETGELVEDLCLALRDVGVGDHNLPDGEWVVSAVLRVRRLHDELSRRGADVTRRLERLSEETSWQMTPLLRDCLMYPEVIPYVRERDGVRRALRCLACRKRDVIGPKGVGVWLCETCAAKPAAGGVRGLMRVAITSVVYDAPYEFYELYEQTPFQAVLVREIPDRGYWVAALPRPLRWSRDGAETSVSHLILEPRRVGTRIGRGMSDVPVNISYVVDERGLTDAGFDFGKCESLAVGTVSDITNRS